MNSTATARIQRSSVSKSRSVVSAPNLRVVTSPAPSRGLFFVIGLCIAIFFTALVMCFSLNTLMVKGAYDVKEIKLELSGVQAREETLMGQVVELSTPVQLAKSASDLGMVPAESLSHIDLEAGTASALDGE
ncbi:MAG: hypothetical protein PUK40_05660 [Actinomycetaceae bacterium]|nr:hypothetical protein [Arcanobacterium sp.]MDD7505417.1 hypothetical protein [Actinomycetaceae bacterium]MDY6142774.1 hypothetical protein [Arcanobacterium sp.]